MNARSLLLELGTEELPPLALPGLSAALAENLVKGLAAAGIPHGQLRSFATPRRLAVLIEACSEQAPDRQVERRGPPVANSFDAAGAPTQAARAFATSCGVAVDQLSRMNTDKGAWLSFRGTEPGASTVASIGGIVRDAIAGLPIAKRMRWGERTAEFVRPVHWIVLLFGADVVATEILGLPSGRITYGHRFHAPRPLSLANADAYPAALRRGKVIAEFARRREVIRSGVVALAAELGGRALIDPRLLDEVTALVEWPVPIAGRFEERFLALPREVVIATVQGHQRYFPVEAAEGRLASWFITVSNIASRDPSKVREGNERVVRPRLSDAAFFWEQDRKLSLDEHAAKLGGVIFQTKLGTYADKTRRVAELSAPIAARMDALDPRVSAGADIARAASLAKADLMTAMVGEFPELQGTMGRYYAAAQGESAAVGLALEEQYLPRHAGDALPTSPTGQALALADKIDTLVGIFSIDQKPTGTKDPFGLRRAALGVLRIVLEGGLDLDLRELLDVSERLQPAAKPGTAGDVYAFMLERLRGLLGDRVPGTTTEMIDAVLAVGRASPGDIEARLRALQQFLAMPDAASLAAANKRIANLLKKTVAGAASGVDAAAFTETAERELYAALHRIEPAVGAAMRRGAYAESLALLASLRTPIDAFFAGVMVMDENATRRDNRLALLREVRAAFGGVADLSRLPG
jgi:glycyl-tRNA synthetase beta chain